MRLPRLVRQAANPIRAGIVERVKPQRTANELPAISARVAMAADAGVAPTFVRECHRAVVDNIRPLHHELVAFHVSEPPGCVKRQRVRVRVIAATRELARYGPSCSRNKREKGKSESETCRSIDDHLAPRRYAWRCWCNEARVPTPAAPTPRSVTAE